MLSLLKRKPKTVSFEMVHEEIDSAEVRIISEVNEILTRETTADFDEIEKLKQIGFGSIKSIKDAENFKSQKEMAKHQATAFDDYKKKYPQYKLITQSEVSRICSKYGLCLGRAEWFTGDIPAKNRKEIVNHTIERTDIKEEEQVRRWVILGDTRAFMDFGYGVPEPRQKPTPKDLYSSTYIISQEKDFNTDGFSLERGKDGQLFVVDKDPVVLIKLAKGSESIFAIISKWGDEAELDEFNA